VSDRGAVRDLLASLPREYPLTAVVHAAGVGQFDAPLAGTDERGFADVVSAKVAGAVHLDELLDGYPLQAFVLVSSGASVWGSGGQGAYAAANAFLDGLAQRRRARGLPATSVAWGAWAGGGSVRGTAEESLRRNGVTPMPPHLAIDALRAAVE